jgi:hypothetical protein
MSDPYLEWQRWFAWHPVRVDGRLVWLRYVERFRVAHAVPDFDWWDYR